MAKTKIPSCHIYKKKFGCSGAFGSSPAQTRALNLGCTLVQEGHAGPDQVGRKLGEQDDQLPLLLLARREDLLKHGAIESQDHLMGLDRLPSIAHQRHVTGPLVLTKYLPMPLPSYWIHLKLFNFDDFYGSFSVLDLQ